MPHGHFRRGVGLRRSLPLPNPTGRPTAPPQPTRGLQWAPVERAHRLAVALYLPKTTCPALGVRLPAETQRWIKAPESSRRWSTTSGPCCAWPRVDRRSARPPQCSTAAPCAPPPERPPWRLRRRQAQGRARRSTRRWTDTLGHLLALRVTPATEQDRKQVETLAARRCKRRPEKASSLPTWTAITPGERAAAEAQARGIRLEVVKHLASKKGFVLLPGRWVVERSLAWASRFLGAL